MVNYYEDNVFVVKYYVKQLFLLLLSIECQFNNLIWSVILVLIISINEVIIYLYLILKVCSCK